MSVAAAEAPTGGVLSALRPGRYDRALRRRSLRRGRERGCSVYIAAEELAKAGIDPNGEAPWYRVWAGSRGGVTVQFYKAP